MMSSTLISYTLPAATIPPLCNKRIISAAHQLNPLHIVTNFLSPYFGMILQSSPQTQQALSSPSQDSVQQNHSLMPGNQLVGAAL